MKTASNSRILRIIPLMLIVGLLCSSAYGKIIYVDDDSMGANDGTSWENAYSFLQDALADANSAPKPVEIRVAQGVYTPDSNSAMPDGTGDREATFWLINDVTLRGGYAGIAEPDHDARDVAAYETILSGDLNGDDAAVVDLRYLWEEPTRAENSYHVVTGSGTDETAVLDGLTITGGNAGEEADDRSGGGMYNYEGSPTLTNCTFSHNSAREGGRGGGMCNRENSSPTLTNCIFNGNPAHSGGGMYNYQSSPILTNCTFSGNWAKGEVSPGGGGMCNLENSNPTLTNCTFSGNWAGSSRGGGMSNGDESSPTLTNCTFSGNWAQSWGGGMCNRENSSPTLTNCIFSGNSAFEGGGMYNYQSSPTLTNCTFSGNSAEGQVFSGGGGMCNMENSSPTLTNCAFIGNSTHGVVTAGGGGMCNMWNSSPTLTNCTFIGNSIEDTAGGRMNNVESNPTLIRCTFSGNWARCGGGMFNLVSSPTLTNCIFSGNSAKGVVGAEGGGMYNCEESSPTLTNCTFSANSARRGGGGIIGGGGDFVLTNCIVWGNSGNQDLRSATVSYSNIQGGFPGEGNIDADPLFAALGYWHDNNTPDDPGDDYWVDGDYHLKSQAGRFDQTTQAWIKDDVTSPCIDAGDPLSPVMYEPHPRGCIINMGAYGGTEEASKSPFGCSYEADGE